MIDIQNYLCISVNDLVLFKLILCIHIGLCKKIIEIVHILLNFTTINLYIGGGFIIHYERTWLLVLMKGAFPHVSDSDTTFKVTCIVNAFKVTHHEKAKSHQGDWVPHTHCHVPRSPITLNINFLLWATIPLTYRRTSKTSELFCYDIGGASTWNLYCIGRPCQKWCWIGFIFFIDFF